MAAVDFFTMLDAGTGPSLRFPSVPVLFDGARPPVARPPRLGEHAREVLTEAGLGAEQVSALVDGDA